MESYKYLIIGGGLAGGRTCQGIRRVDEEGSIALVSAEEHIPYERPPLSKGYFIGEDPLEKVFVKERSYYDENGIDLILGVTANAINPDEHTVALSDGQAIQYEKLMLATGGSAKSLPLPGTNLGGVYTLRTIEDSQAIQQAANENDRALVVGGSFIGSEIAAGLAMRGVEEITMIFLESRLLERMAPEEMSHYIEDRFKAEGIRIRPATRPARFEGNGNLESVRLEDGEEIEVEMAVLGVGIALNTRLAEGAGLELNDEGAILVDEYLRTSHPDIYAAGDIASWPDPTFDKRMRVEHWDVARAQGYRAGRNMAGQEGSYTRLPYFFSDLFDLSFEAWGDFAEWDRTVRRGSLGDEANVAYFYFRDGTLVAAVSMGRPDDERDPIQDLIKARAAYDDVAEQVQDEDVDLADLTK